MEFSQPALWIAAYKKTAPSWLAAAKRVSSAESKTLGWKRCQHMAEFWFLALASKNEILFLAFSQSGATAEASRYGRPAHEDSYSRAPAERSSSPPDGITMAWSIASYSDRRKFKTSCI